VLWGTERSAWGTNTQEDRGGWGGGGRKHGRGCSRLQAFMSRKCWRGGKGADREAEEENVNFCDLAGRVVRRPWSCNLCRGKEDRRDASRQIKSSS